MNPRPEHAAAAEEGDRETPRVLALSARARSIAVVTWCSFLAAAAGTMVCFALLDPHAVSRGVVPAWWTSRHTVYAIGFFFFWAIAAAASALTLYMAQTEHVPEHPDSSL
jgi:hypothetical protein